MSVPMEQAYIHFASQRLEGIRGEAQPLAIGKAMFRLYNDRAGRQVLHVGTDGTSLRSFRKSET